MTSWHLRLGLILASGGLLLCSCRQASGPPPDFKAESADGISYTNDVIPATPWSICVARVSRTNSNLSIQSTHAFGRAVGLSTLSQQIRDASPKMGRPLIAVNGDFYQRDRGYVGDSRGLQIIDGELISAPVGTAAFWIDNAGNPHTDNVQPRFVVTLPDGSTAKFGLNEERRNNNIVLFTPAIGVSTKAGRGLDVVLEKNGTNAWLPLKVGELLSARVREVREGGDTALGKDVAVLSVGPGLTAAQRIKNGDLLTLSTATTPELRHIKTAIGGGPVLVRAGKRQRMDSTGLFDPGSYASSSMRERHPRSAVGWNNSHFYLMQVDGRQKSSAGMTLEEVANYMIRLGCQEAMNLDGGGSATFWFNGRVMNRPCDGREREIANGLVFWSKAATP